MANGIHATALWPPASLRKLSFKIPVQPAERPEKLIELSRYVNILSFIEI
jgi:hypothetical protein